MNTLLNNSLRTNTTMFNCMAVPDSFNHFADCCSSGDLSQIIAQVYSKPGLSIDAAFRYSHKCKSYDVFELAVKEFSGSIDTHTVNRVFGCRSNHNHGRISRRTTPERRKECVCVLDMMVAEFGDAISDESYERAFTAICRHRCVRAFRMFATELRDKISPEVCDRALIRVVEAKKDNNLLNTHLYDLVREFGEQLSPRACKIAYKILCTYRQQGAIIFFLANLGHKIDTSVLLGNKPRRSMPSPLDCSLLFECARNSVSAAQLLLQTYASCLDTPSANALLMLCINSREEIAGQIIIHCKDKINGSEVIRNCFRQRVTLSTLKQLIRSFEGNIDADVVAILLRLKSDSLYRLLTVDKVIELVDAHQHDSRVVDALALLDPTNKNTQCILDHISRKIKAVNS